MSKRIAVEETLTAVSDLLAENGYEVVNLDPISNSGAELESCKAIVITGQDSNVFGKEDVVTKSIVIQAEGKTPNEILAQIESRIGKE
jgi:hypothetical protein